MKYTGAIAAVRRHKSSVLFLLPFSLIFLAFTVIPIFIAIFFSLTSFNVFNPPVFVGFENYRKLFLEDEIFLSSRSKIPSFLPR